jgi:hypothetical protein
LIAGVLDGRELWGSSFTWNPSEMGASIPKCRQPDPSILKGEAQVRLHHIRDDQSSGSFLKGCERARNDFRESIAAVQDYLPPSARAHHGTPYVFFERWVAILLALFCYGQLFDCKRRVPLVSLNPAVAHQASGLEGQNDRHGSSKTPI